MKQDIFEDFKSFLLLSQLNINGEIFYINCQSTKALKNTMFGFLLLLSIANNIECLNRSFLII